MHLIDIQFMRYLIRTSFKELDEETISCWAGRIVDVGRSASPWRGVWRAKHAVADAGRSELLDSGSSIGAERRCRHHWRTYQEASVGRRTNDNWLCGIQSGGLGTTLRPVPSVPCGSWLRMPGARRLQQRQQHRRQQKQQQLRPPPAEPDVGGWRSRARIFLCNVRHASVDQPGVDTRRC